MKQERKKQQLFVELRNLSLRQETLERQKSKVKWISSGDLNTKYFHLMIKGRRINNVIKGVRINGN